MNPPQLLPLPATEPPADPALSDPLPSADPDQPRRNGKIAHLTKAQRDLINQGFDDGVKYEDIRSKLAEQGVTLNLKNLSDWFHGGYQDELKARERRAELRASQERLFEIARHDDAPDLSLVGLQLAVTQLSQQLYDLAPGSHKDNFQTDTHNYLRMLNTLGRLSRSLLSLQQYRDKKAQSTATELQKLDEDRDLNDNESLLLVNRMDRLFRRRVGKSFSSSCSSSSSSGSRGSSSSSFSSSSSNESPTAPAPPIAPVTSAPPTSLTAPEPPTGPASPVLPEPRPLSGINPPIQQSTNPVPDEVGRVTPLATSKRNEDGLAASKRSEDGLATPKSVEGGHHKSEIRPRIAQRSTAMGHPICGGLGKPNLKSEIDERCHCCRKYLPPRLPNGQRPFDKCQICGTALRPLELLHLFCPDCGGRLDQIFDNDHRTSNQCPHCFTTLPDDAPDPPHERRAA